VNILERIPGERFSQVLPLWAGRTVVLIGGGPSLTLEQVDQVRAAHEAGDVKVIAINDAYLWAPFADVHYAGDSHWHKWHTEGIPKPMLGLSAAAVRERWSGFAGQKCTIQNSGANVKDEAVHMLRNRDFPVHGQGLSRDPLALVTGRHSGFQALNVSTLAGAAVGILLGFDGQPAKDGATHFFGEHPRPTPQQAYEFYRRAFSAAENAIADIGVRVINCSPGSRIDSFEKADLAEVISGLAK